MNALNEENDPLGIMALWSRTPGVPLGHFLAYVDIKLLSEIISDPIGDMRCTFEYFNSNTKKPLMPREFWKFWNSLSHEDQIYYMNEIMAPRMKMTGIKGIVDSRDVEIINANLDGVEKWKRENP